MSAVTDREVVEARKLKYAPQPDLKIVVGGGCIYHYHALSMAMHSDYIDTMLASPMRESSLMEISFPDIEDSDWQAMLKYLQPRADPPSSLEEIEAVAIWYDKYSFEEGRRICDIATKEYIKDPVEESDFESITAALLLANQCHLKESQLKGNQVLSCVLNEPSKVLLLGQENLVKLVPLILEIPSLVESIASQVGYAGDDNMEFVESNLFPLLFLTTNQRMELEMSLSNPPARVKVSLAGTNVINGIYALDSDKESPEYWRKGIYGLEGQHEVTFRIRCDLFSCGKRLWNIFCEYEGEEFLFYKQGAGTKNLPPLTGWVVEATGVAPAPTLSFLMV